MVSETTEIEARLRALKLNVEGLLAALEDENRDRIRAEWENAEVFEWEDILYSVETELLPE